MTATMLHRGPDASGIWICPKAQTGLGHRRLSIIDTSDAGTQPFVSSDGRYVISFNGEIYNFLELRPLLEAKGSVFRTRTDTEVLIEAIRHWGPEALERLDGMFAFALHDTATGELMLARDAFGEKPLYYVSNDRRFAFASELQALQTLPDFDFSVSAGAIAEYLAFQYIGAPRTLYRGASKLPPGHFMRVSPDGRMRLQRYFEFQPASTESRDTRPLEELAEECEEILVRSLRRRLISDVPLGAFLSGGVDSSTTVALATRVLGRTMKTFSIGFEGAPESEHLIAREFARHLGTEHEDAIFQPNQAEMAESIGRKLDEPNGDTSCAPTYLLCGLARKHVTVAISGDGGDEMFFGYGRYLRMMDERQLFESYQRLEWTLGSGYYSDQILVNTETELRRFLGYVPDSLRSHLGALRGELDRQSKRAVDVLRKTDVENYLPGAVLAKVDRMSMQHSLEVRTPFLSTELARFAEKLPISALYGGGVGKLILRHIAKKYLPAHLVDLPKKGFGLPMTDWARESLVPRLVSQFGKPSSLLAKVIPRTAMDRFLQLQKSSLSPYRIWGLNILGFYCEHHPVSLIPESPNLTQLALVTSDFAALPLLVDLWQVAKPVLLLCVDELPVWFASLPPGSVIVSRWPGKLPESSALHYVQCGWEVRGAVDELLKSIRLKHSLAAGVIYFGRDDGNGAAVSSLVDLVSFVLHLSPTISFWSFYLSGGTRFECRGASSSEAHPPAQPKEQSAFQRFATFLSRRIFVLSKGGVKRASRLMVRHAGRLLPAWKFGKLTERVFEYREELPRNITSKKRALTENGEPVRRLAPDLTRRIADVLAGHANDETAAAADKLVTETAWTVVNDRIIVATPDPHALEHGLREYCLRRRGSLSSRLFEGRNRWFTRQDRPSSADGDAQWKAFGSACSDFIRADNEDQTASDRALDRRAVMVTWALSSGGAERQFAICARHLREMGVDVIAYSLNPLNGFLAHYLPTLREGAVPVRTVTSPSGEFDFDQVLGKTSRNRTAARTLALLPNEICQQTWSLYTHFMVDRPHAVYAQMDWPGICSAVAGILAGVPRIVVSFRGMSPERTPHWGSAVEWVRSSFLMLRNSNRVCLSGNSQAGNDDYANWLKIPPSDLLLIRNGVQTGVLDDAKDPGMCEKVRTELGLSPSAKVLLGVFRLDPEKRPDLFVELCSQLLAKFPDLIVLHAGGGLDHKRIAKRIAERKLGERFRLLGRRADTYTLMKVASVVCLTSAFEGTPNVLLEAQYQGTPVVAFNVGGVPEAVAIGESGFVVADGDNSAWSDACARLLADEALRTRMGAAGKKFVSEAYSLDTSCKTLLRAMGIAKPETIG